MRRSAALAVACLFALPLLTLASEPAEGSRLLALKADPALARSLAAGPAEFLCVLGEQADLGGAAVLRSKAAKGEYVTAALRETAERTQRQVLAELESSGAPHRAFWVANMVWVRGDLKTAERLALLPEVSRLSANPPVPFQAPAEEALREEAAGAVEWNVSRVRAPDVWALGYRGQGVVVAGQDTGYRWKHKALKGHYRGWDGRKASHDYNWHDAVHDRGGPCGHDALKPCDDHGHGTHTMGTMVGDDGKGNQIGLAPAARWIGCRNMDRGYGTPASYSECFQWFLAPTDLKGQNPDPSKAPHVINNSWGCPPSEGCTDPEVLRLVVEAARAAGIVVVASAGNSGPFCGSITDPPPIYSASLAVAATDDQDEAATFSSRGPVPGEGRTKPEVSAPGVGVRSCTNSGNKSYAAMSGTSMAGPHAAGAVALILSARPDLTGQVDRIEDILMRTCVPRTASEGCGGDAPNAVPNHTYGWGRIDALAAVQAALAEPAP